MPYRIMYQGRLAQLEQTRKTYCRLVSLVPSQTEYLWHLGLDAAVLGITRFCVHPEAWYRSKARIGGTKDVKLDRLAALKPDLVLANKEENIQAQIEAIAGTIADVYVSDVADLSSACQMMLDIGALTNRDAAAEATADAVRHSFNHHLPPLEIRPIPCAYFIWKNPWMVAGGDTFIHHMLELGGFSNVFSEQTRYPEVSLTDSRLKEAAVILLSSEPYPFKQRHAEALQAIFPDKQIILTDGELLSWYGSRLLHTAAYLKQLNQRLTQTSSGDS